MNIYILNDKRNFKGVLSGFEGNSIMNDNTFIGCIKYHKKTANNCYIDVLELKKEFKGKGYGREILQLLLKTFNIIELSADKKAIGFWLKMGAKDLGRDTGTHGAGDREMIINKKDFLNTIFGKQKPRKLETFFDKPYNQLKDKFDDNEKSHLYKSVWNDNKLPIGTKLYEPTEKDIKEYGDYKGKLYSLTPTGKNFIIAKEGMKVTRYYNIKYEKGGGGLNVYERLEFAFKNFDAMVNGDMIEIYK